MRGNFTSPPRRLAGSGIEPEQQYVAVLHDIFLTFIARLASLFRRDFAAKGDVIVIGDRLSANEAALEIGMDDASRLRRFVPRSIVQARVSFGPAVK
jgi:hypothetical protein